MLRGENIQMYDGRKVEKIVSDPPYLENYTSDYLQLGFFYQEFEKTGIGAYYELEEDQFGYNPTHLMNINLFALKKYLDVSWDLMVNDFVESWVHEYLHMIGLNEDGLNIIKSEKIMIDLEDDEDETE